MDFDLEKYGIDIGLLVSGVFGAVLSTSKHASRNMGRTIYSLVGGAASANYLAPVLITLTKMSDNHYQYGLAFILGFLGLKGIEYFSHKLVPDGESEEVIKEEPPKQLKSKRTIKKQNEHTDDY